MEEELLRALFKASASDNSEIITSLLAAVRSVIPVKMCSLWKVNNNCKCLSIYAREKYNPPIILEHEFIHPIEGSLIGYLLKKISEEKRKYIDILSVAEEPYIKYHKSPNRVEELGLHRMICIPIVNSDTKNENIKTDAVLNIYPQDGVVFKDSYAEIIQDYFSLTLSRSRHISREELTRDIIGVYEGRASKDLSSVLHPILHHILKKYLKYEGCSIFIWDPFSNRLNLTQTTGISGKPAKSEVFYYLGEGLTGRIAKNKEPVMLKDVKNITEQELSKDYEHKWTEETSHIGKSFMGIPIMSPSHPTELLGVIRFTNKLNMLANVVDQFSNEDYDLINHATNLIALYMDYEQGEKIRTAFAMQMAHEMLTPATAIRGSARRLQRNWYYIDFPREKVNDYLNSILDHAELQIALTRTIEYAWKGTAGASRSSRYQVSECNIEEDVIKKSKKLIIPIARGEDLTFDNIKTKGTFPILFIDRFAFEQVFFNLLTNAIKYRNYTKPESFSVIINSHGLDEYNVPEYDSEPDETENNINSSSSILQKGHLITVEDCGLGISRREASKIFNLGYRKKEIERINVRGLGIGLFVVKRILSDFECKIWVSSYKEPTILSIFIPEMLSSDLYLKTDNWRKS